MTDRLAGRWFAVRPARNRKPVTYRCPFCGDLLPALGEHMLVLPEGGPTGRRHAHTGCVMAARRAGRLPTRAEWERAQPRPPSRWQRVRDRLRR